MGKMAGQRDACMCCDSSADLIIIVETRASANTRTYAHTHNHVCSYSDANLYIDYSGTSRQPVANVPT